MRTILLKWKLDGGEFMGRGLVYDDTDLTALDKLFETIKADIRANVPAAE